MKRNTQFDIPVNGYLMVCARCGSANVFEPMWVNPNNHDIGGNNGFEGLCHWCSDCNATTTIIDEADFNEKTDCQEKVLEGTH